jgi:hypothetical protein
MILGLMLAAVAIPTGIVGTWFTREVDGVRAELREISENLVVARDAALQASSNSLELKEQLDSLVVAMARTVADPVASPETIFALERLVPPDVFEALKREGGDLSYVKYGIFDSTSWVFMSSSDLNTLDSDVQAKLRKSLIEMEVRFEIELVAD